MTEAKPVQQTADIRAMDRHPAPLQRNAQFVEGQLAVLLKARANEVGMPGKLAAAHAMTLPARLKRTGFGPQLHQIVYKARRDPEMTRRRPAAVPFLDKRNNTHAQFHWQ